MPFYFSASHETGAYTRDQHGTVVAAMFPYLFASMQPP